MEQDLITFSFQVNGLPADLFDVLRFRGTEEILKPFRYDVELISSQGVDFASVMGKPATLTVSGESDGRTVHGRICQFAQIGYDLADGQPAKAIYQACLVPEVWQLSRRHDLRIFQQLDIEEILKKVFQKAGLPSDCYEFKLGSHAPREYCVQHQESDLNFILRLMELEGAYYFFDHQNKSKMVIADDPSDHVPIQDAVIPFMPPSGMVETYEHVKAFRFSQQLLEDKVSLRDYNYETPPYMSAEATFQDGALGFEFYDYPGGFADAGTGQGLSVMRLEGLRAQEFVGQGTATCRRFAPGYKFTLDRHPIPGFNCEYLIIGEKIYGGPFPSEDSSEDASPSYRSEFSCIPSPIPFRSPCKTLIPKIHTQTATVVGPSGEEIYTDNLGRIKVQFHWDRDGQNNEESSCWIRVKQMWSGPGWGTLFIPRIGMEVVVEFLEGNPDFPLVTGCVYNGANPLPYSLPADKTKSTIKTNSSKGGGGSNELRFEDKAGSEEIFLHGQKDWTIAIENDKNQTVGHDETLDVGNDRTKSVGHDQQETIGNDKTINVTNNHTETIGNDMTIDVGNNLSETIGSDMTVNVGSNLSETIGSNRTTNVTSNHTETIGSNMTINVNQNLTETVAINYAENVGAAMQLSIGAAYTETVGAVKTETIGANKTVNVRANLSEDVGGNHSEQVKNAYSLKAKTITVQADDQITFKTGKAQIVMKKNGDIQINGKKIQIKGSGNIIIKGKKILEN